MSDRFRSVLVQIDTDKSKAGPCMRLAYQIQLGRVLAQTHYALYQMNHISGSCDNFRSACDGSG